MQELVFDYFRGMEAEQYSFYRIPKVLFTGDCFKNLSCEAKVLYGLMLDRMSLSLKNQWFDEEDRAYIIFTVEEIMELLGCGRQKAVKNIAELDSEKGIGLIEKKRLGLGKPNVIYVKNFIIQDAAVEDPEDSKEEKPENIQEYDNPAEGESELSETPKSDSQKYENHTSGSSKSILPETAKSRVQQHEKDRSGNWTIRFSDSNDARGQKQGHQTSGNSNSLFSEVPKSYFQKYENQTSGSMKNELQEVRKSNGNETDLNNTEFRDSDNHNLINQSPSALAKADGVFSDALKTLEVYRDMIRRNIDYELFRKDSHFDLEDVDEMIELMADIMTISDNSTLRIAGADRPAAIVKKRFMMLNYEHIQYVLDCLNRKTGKVGNIKAYLLTALYNAPVTIRNYYAAKVRHDLYGDGTD